MSAIIAPRLHPDGLSWKWATNDSMPAVERMTDVLPYAWTLCLDLSGLVAAQMSLALAPLFNHHNRRTVHELTLNRRAQDAQFTG